jgi:hypothetical protein
MELIGMNTEEWDKEKKYEKESATFLQDQMNYFLNM